MSAELAGTSIELSMENDGLNKKDVKRKREKEMSFQRMQQQLNKWMVKGNR